jgi:hypothetical protein
MVKHFARSVGIVAMVAACKGAPETNPPVGSATPSARTAPSTASAQQSPATTARAPKPPSRPLLETVFEIASYTRNTAACDVEGASILADLRDHRYLYVYEADAFGGRLATTISCATVEDCKAKARAWREKEEPPQTNLPLMFDKTLDPAHREGVHRDTGAQEAFVRPPPGQPPPPPAGCKQAASGVTTLALEGDVLTLELRAVRGDLPPSAEGYCTTDAPERAFRGKPCNLYEVVKAKVAGPL